MAPIKTSRAKRVSSSVEKRVKTPRRAKVSSAITPPLSPSYMPQHAGTSRRSPISPKTHKTSTGGHADSSFHGLDALSNGLSVSSSPFSTDEAASDSLIDLEMSDYEQMEVDDGEITDIDHADSTSTSVRWDSNLGCPARPISAPCTETVDSGLHGPHTKCLCGASNGGRRVSDRHPRKWHYMGPNFYFNEPFGAFIVENNPSLSTPFHIFELDGKTICQPVTVSKEEYVQGKRGGRLSSERTVPECAHFPVSGLAHYNVPFVKGRICHRTPNAQCPFFRIQDQARSLCLIEDEVRADGSIRRRMNIHAPPADWTDPAAISYLNRWRAQFRQRKLHITTREGRKRWSRSALNYLVDCLARNPSTHRAELARDISERFHVPRSEHAVSCAIDNHKLRSRAKTLRKYWEDTNRLGRSCPTDHDVGMEDVSAADEEAVIEDDSDTDSDGDSIMGEASDDHGVRLRHGDGDTEMTDWTF